jgi:hypothetical protein
MICFGDVQIEFFCQDTMKIVHETEKPYAITENGNVRCISWPSFAESKLHELVVAAFRKHLPSSISASKSCPQASDDILRPEVWKIQ